ncbi:sugar ABC transporter substrate-binding protein [Paenibacillus nasutitermitis]|uniref:Sugar ABC transporter substrate-binding protein n=2 Tax=Paenibacillus nasutitermitis TaxID=1652958 RepID=A0A917E0N3_9BACL|nr:sugar ABC transporter substrate-binding protein [Paenibacillus nasutitermitis]
MPPFGTGDTLDKEFWTTATASFAKENNVDLQIEIVPWEKYEEKYLTGISSGNGPDVGYMYNEMIYDYVNMGALEPLDRMITDAERDNFYYLNHGVMTGKQYGLPIVVGNARVLYYNKDILDAKGVQVPKTWEEFRTAAKTLTDGDKYGYVMPWGDQASRALNIGFFPYLWQAGGEIISSDGKSVAFNSEAGIKALKFINDMKNVDKSMPDSVTSMNHDDADQYFLSGKSAFIMEGTSFASQIEKQGIKWGFITSLTDQAAGTFIATDMLILTKSSKNKELAYKLMLHMLKGDTMTEFHKMASFPPIAKDEEFHDNPLFKSLYENDKSAFRTLPVARMTSKIYDYLLKNIQLVMIGQSTPEKALKDTEAYANSLLNE